MFGNQLANRVAGIRELCSGVDEWAAAKTRSLDSGHHHVEQGADRSLWSIGFGDEVVNELLLNQVALGNVGDDEPVFGSVMLVERRLGNAGLADQPVDADAANTVVIEEPVCRLENATFGRSGRSGEREGEPGGALADWNSLNNRHSVAPSGYSARCPQAVRQLTGLWGERPGFVPREVRVRGITGGTHIFG